MNKPLKFRLWDDQYGVMTYWHDDGPIPFISVLCTYRDLILGCPSTIKLQEFTGFIDKNGKGVYDTDLILADGYGPYLVFWQDGSWCSCAYGDHEALSYYKKIEVVGHALDRKTEFEGRQL